MKIRLVEVKLFHSRQRDRQTVRQTDMTKLKVAVRNFSESKI